jgi:hypothetical protein
MSLSSAVHVRIRACRLHEIKRAAFWFGSVFLDFQPFFFFFFFIAKQFVETGEYESGSPQ